MKSDCHGFPVIPLMSWLDYGTSGSQDGWYCVWCRKPCTPVEEKSGVDKEAVSE